MRGSNRGLWIAIAAACGTSKTEPSPSPTGSGSGSAIVATLDAARDARCGEPCRFLSDTPLASIGSTYKTACGSDAAALDDCATADFARNCVYAVHNATFTKPRWKTAFSAKPWYHADPAIAAKSVVLTATEAGNVKALAARGTECRNNKISERDLGLVHQWFAKTPASPAIDFEDKFVDGKQLTAALGKSAKPIFAAARAGKLTSEYVKPPLLKPTVDSASGDVHEIMVTITVPGQDPPGIYAEFLYNLDDTLVGVSVQRISLDDLTD